MYKGYYYDEDLECYYLKSRFYMPSVCRFISPDDHSYLDYEDLRGINLYCYCYDNPVMYSDPDGNMVITTIFLLVCIGIGAIVGGTYAGVTAYNEGYRGWDLAGKTTAGVLIGGGIGGLVGYVAGPLAASIFGISGSIGLSGGIGAFALASSGTIAGTLVSVSAAGISAAGALVANGLLMLSRPNSGRIRFSDDTGIDPDTGKPVTDKKRAEEIYESLKDSKKRAKWRQWIKGKKWRKSHLR